VQVDLLKDQVEEVEEQNSLILKELRAKSHDYELLKRDHEESKRAVQLLQAALQDHQAMVIIIISVEDPGSGALLTPGSGIRDPGWVESQHPDPG
jgi:hypothetical protein